MTTDRSRGQLPLIVDTEMLLSGHHPGFSPEGRGSQMGSVLRRNLRAQSQDRILGGPSRARVMNSEGKIDPFFCYTCLAPFILYICFFFLILQQN